MLRWRLDLNTRITTLSDNTAGMGDFLAEWGLSFLIEQDGQKVLFDSGAGGSVTHNAGVLNVDLKAIDRIVLSHGHYDHTGGLRDVLSQAHKEIEIIAHPDIQQKKYDIRGKHPPKYIGMPFQFEELENLGARFRFTKEPVAISENLMTTGEIPMITDFESIDPSLFIKQEGQFCPDQVKDDQGIIIKSEGGLIVILGCAHRGLINTLYQAQKITGIKPIKAVLGGAHLVGSSEERLWQTIAALKELDIPNLALCHCTDLPAISVLAQEFGPLFSFNRTGSKFEF
jgi:7,8-dihydropterin-6-yl-methyl-4-(beta-D-ribofuranosyl)aminobenzene 5'-phosphate synthase